MITDSQTRDLLIHSLVTIFYLFALLTLGTGLFRWKQWLLPIMTHARGIKTCFWSTKEIIQLTGMIVFINSQLFLIGQIGRHFGLLSTEIHRVLFTTVSFMILYCLFFLCVHLFLKRKRTTASEAFGFKSLTLQSATKYAALTLLGILIPLNIIGFLTESFYHFVGWPVESQPVVQLFLSLKSTWTKAVFVLMPMIGAPLMEETLFRGMIYSYLKNKFGLFHAIWLTSALFAASHFHIPSIPILFCLGIAFTLIYEWTESLAAPIILHALFNTTSIVTLLILK